jgi:hypothetical protein
VHTFANIEFPSLSQDLKIALLQKPGVPSADVAAKWADFLPSQAENSAKISK